MTVFLKFFSSFSAICHRLSSDPLARGHKFVLTKHKMNLTASEIAKMDKNLWKALEEYLNGGFTARALQPPTRVAVGPGLAFTISKRANKSCGQTTRSDHQVLRALFNVLVKIVKIHVNSLKSL